MSGWWLCTFYAPLVPHGGEVLVQNQGTRWDSNREIDWLCTRRVLDVPVPTCARFHFSDHNALEVCVPIRATECEQGFLTPAVSWKNLRKPPRNSGGRGWLKPGIPRTKSKCSINKLGIACSLFRSHGTCTCSCSMACSPRPSLPTARLYERRRWQGGSRERREAARAEATTLCLKLGLSPDPFCAFVKDQVAELIPASQHELKDAEDTRKRRVLTDWKHRLLNEPCGMGKWLKNREAIAVCKVTGLGWEATSPTEVAALLSDYWQDFWSRQGARPL